MTSASEVSSLSSSSGSSSSSWIPSRRLSRGIETIGGAVGSTHSPSSSSRSFSGNEGPTKTRLSSSRRTSTGCILSKLLVLGGHLLSTWTVVQAQPVMYESQPNKNIKYYTTIAAPGILQACLCRTALGEGFSVRKGKCRQGSTTSCEECPWQYDCAESEVLAGTGVQIHSGDCEMFPKGLQSFGTVNPSANCKEKPSELKFPMENLISADSHSEVSTALSNPVSVTADKYGNLYIADTTNNRVRMMTPSKVMTTIVNAAGQFGFAGDGGPAQLARTRFPEAVAVDSTGALLFSDFLNQRIRRVEMITETGINNGVSTKIQSPGIIQTVVGNGIRGSGCPSSTTRLRELMNENELNGNNYDNERGITENQKRELNALGVEMQKFQIENTDESYGWIKDTTEKRELAGGTPEPSYCDPLVAMMRYPRGLALDSQNNLYIVDSGNHVIRRVSGFNTTTLLYEKFESFIGTGLRQNTEMLYSAYHGDLLSGSWVSRNNEIALGGAYSVYVDERDSVWTLDTLANRVLYTRTIPDEEIDLPGVLGKIFKHYVNHFIAHKYPRDLTAVTPSLAKPLISQFTKWLVADGLITNTKANTAFLPKFPEQVGYTYWKYGSSESGYWCNEFDLKGETEKAVKSGGELCGPELPEFARFRGISGICEDISENLYLADTGNSVLLKINRHGKPESQYKSVRQAVSIGGELIYKIPVIVTHYDWDAFKSKLRDDLYVAQNIPQHTLTGDYLTKFHDSGDAFEATTYYRVNTHRGMLPAAKIKGGTSAFCNCLCDYQDEDGDYLCYTNTAGYGGCPAAGTGDVFHSGTCKKLADLPHPVSSFNVSQMVALNITTPAKAGFTKFYNKQSVENWFKELEAEGYYSPKTLVYQALQGITIDSDHTIVDCQTECDSDTNCKAVVAECADQTCHEMKDGKSCVMLAKTTPYHLYDIDKSSGKVKDMVVEPKYFDEGGFDYHNFLSTVDDTISLRVCGTTYRAFDKQSLDRSSGGCGMDVDLCKELCIQVGDSCKGWAFPGCFLSKDKPIEATHVYMGERVEPTAYQMFIKGGKDRISRVAGKKQVFSDIPGSNGVMKIDKVELNNPTSCVVKNTDIYLTDTRNHKLRKFGHFLTTCGNRTDLFTNAEINDWMSKVDYTRNTCGNVDRTQGWKQSSFAPIYVDPDPENLFDLAQAAAINGRKPNVMANTFCRQVIAEQTLVGTDIEPGVGAWESYVKQGRLEFLTTCDICKNLRPLASAMPETVEMDVKLYAHDNIPQNIEFLLNNLDNDGYVLNNITFIDFYKLQGGVIEDTDQLLLPNLSTIKTYLQGGINAGASELWLKFRTRNIVLAASSCAYHEACQCRKSLIDVMKTTIFKNCPIGNAYVDPWHRTVAAFLECYRQQSDDSDYYVHRTQFTPSVKESIRSSIEKAAFGSTRILKEEYEHRLRKKENEYFFGKSGLQKEEKKRLLVRKQDFERSVEEGSRVRKLEEEFRRLLLDAEKKNEKLDGGTDRRHLTELKSILETAQTNLTQLRQQIEHDQKIFNSGEEWRKIYNDHRQGKLEKKKLEKNKQGI